MLRRFLLSCLLFTAPILLVVGVVAWVDPYDFFGDHGPVPLALKKKNLFHSGRTMAFSNVMWDLVDFKRTPVPNVVLGDSRLAYFDMDALESTSGMRYFNFGVPGGNYRTISDLFGYADAHAQLKNVYVQTSFRGMNKGIDYDLFKEPNMLVDKPHLYLLNRRVMEATALNLFSRVLPDHVEYDKTPADQWQLVLGMEEKNASTFETDTTKYALLQHIADRCKAEGVRLVFVEFPTHPDVHRIYTEAGADPLREAYYARMRSIATVIDLDRPGLFVTDHSFWRDPMHLTKDAQRQLIKLVWGGAPDVLSAN